jgi:hypothetical protein
MFVKQLFYCIHSIILLFILFSWIYIPEIGWIQLLSIIWYCIFNNDILAYIEKYFFKVSLNEYIKTIFNYNLNGLYIILLCINFICCIIYNIYLDLIEMGKFFSTFT